MRYCFTTKYRFYELLNLWSSPYNAFKTHEPHKNSPKLLVYVIGYIVLLFSYENEMKL